MATVELQPDVAGSPRLDGSLQALLAEFTEWHSPARKPSPKFRAALNHTARIVALNLLSVAVSQAIPWIAIMGRPAWYTENRLLHGSQITHASVQRVVSFLSERGYVKFRPGRASKSKSFRRPNAIRPTQKFRALISPAKGRVFDVWSDPTAYPIRLREAPDAKGRKKFIPFEPTGATLLMADRLETINNAQLRHWPDLEITDLQHREMLRYMSRRDGQDSTVALSRRTLYRVFNNGTFEEGGRFYGGWWQGIPKAYRPYITLNGKQTVEVDYSAIHPTILYNELGIPMPDDPYEIEGLGNRELVKKTVNALINAGGPNIKPVEGFSEGKVGMFWKEFLATVKRHFALFKPYFGTGYGLKLQRIDSDIAESVMVRFSEKSIPILPVHDSFIVHYGHADLLQMTMQEEFEQITGASIRLKTVISGQRERRSSQEEPVTDDVLELLYPSGPYSKHDQRVLDWFDR